MPCVFAASLMMAHAPQNPKQAAASAQQSESQRIPRQRGDTAGIIGRVQGKNAQLPTAVHIVFTNASSPKKVMTEVPADADGIFRAALPSGSYSLLVEAPGFEAFRKEDVVLNAGEVLTVEVLLQPSPASADNHALTSEAQPSGRHIPNENAANESAEAPYRELSRRADENLAEINASSIAPSNDQLFLARPDRWKTNMPSWDRYQRKGDYPYVMGHWWDPFNRNKFKGDYPIFGQQTFFNFTGTSVTAFDWRRLPVPSGVGSASPGEAEFFGRGEQGFLEETVR